jgi:hypothetical protein
VHMQALWWFSEPLSLQTLPMVLRRELRASSLLGMCSMT